ncbi:MAG: beta-hydroxyacyl-ACP dehydratase [Phycisphaerales bacterium]|nr:beta-hydroxyacyl-ACP dehydratase [Phycisphaerales bacterium]
MKFVLVDRICELEVGKRIVTQKSVTLAEEYLADHFPRFPVLPGVMMLEAMVQSAAWLVRATLDFAPAFVLLKEARNVTYKSFVVPGQTLTIEAVCKNLAPDESVFQTSGSRDGEPVLKGQLVLRHLNLADVDPQRAGLDEKMRTRMRSLYALLWSEQSAVGAAGSI